MLANAKRALRKARTTAAQRKLASGPRGCLNLDGRIHFPAIRFAVLTRIEIPHV